MIVFVHSDEEPRNEYIVLTFDTTSEISPLTFINEFDYFQYIFNISAYNEGTCCDDPIPPYPNLFYTIPSQDFNIDIETSTNIDTNTNTSIISRINNETTRIEFGIYINCVNYSCCVEAYDLFVLPSFSVWLSFHFASNKVSDYNSSYDMMWNDLSFNRTSFNSHWQEISSFDQVIPTESPTLSPTSPVEYNMSCLFSSSDKNSILCKFSRNLTLYFNIDDGLEVYVKSSQLCQDVIDDGTLQLMGFDNENCNAVCQWCDVRLMTKFEDYCQFSVNGFEIYLSNECMINIGDLIDFEIYQSETSIKPVNIEATLDIITDTQATSVVNVYSPFYGMFVCFFFVCFRALLNICCFTFFWFFFFFLRLLSLPARSFVCTAFIIYIQAITKQTNKQQQKQPQLYI